MEKKDLRTGMYLEFENGNDKIVLLDTEHGDVVCNKELATARNSGSFTRLFNHFDLSNWNDDLTSNCVGIVGDVIRIRGTLGTVIWERPKEKPILTLDGIEYSESTLRSIIKKATE